MYLDSDCRVETVLGSLLNSLKQCNRRFEDAASKEDEQTGQKTYVMHDNAWYGTSWFSNWSDF